MFNIRIQAACFSFHKQFENFNYLISVEVSTKATGKMVNAMDWGWSQEGDGYIGGNGPKASRGGTVSDSPRRQPPSTRELGRMDSRTDMAPKLMQMEVGNHFINFNSS